MTELQLVQAQQTPELQQVRRLDENFYPPTYHAPLAWYQDVVRRVPLAFWLLKVRGKPAGSGIQYPLHPKAWQALSEGHIGEEDLSVQAIPGNLPTRHWYLCGLGLKAEYRDRGWGQAFGGSLMRRILLGGGYGFPLRLVGIPISPVGRGLMEGLGLTCKQPGTKTVDDYPRMVARFSGPEQLEEALERFGGLPEIPPA